MSDISILRTMVNEGVISKVDNKYGIELNGEKGLQPVEIISPDMNKTPGYQVDDILEFVVNMVDDIPKITKVADIVEQNRSIMDTTIYDKYQEYLKVRMEGKYVLPDGQYVLGTVIARREGFLTEFTTSVSLDVTLVYGQSAKTKPGVSVLYQAGGDRVLACDFMSPVEVAIPPFFDNIEVDRVNYLPSGRFSFVSLYRPTIVELSVGSVLTYGFNGTPAYSVFVAEDMDIVINQDNLLHVKKFGRFELAADSYTVIRVSASQGEVLTPSGELVAIKEFDYHRYNVVENVKFYESGLIKEFRPAKKLLIDNGGTSFKQMAGGRLSFYESGEVYFFTPAADTEMKLVNGEIGILKAGSLQFLNRNGEAYYCMLTEPIEINIAEGIFRTKVIEFSNDGTGIVSFFSYPTGKRIRPRN